MQKYAFQGHLSIEHNDVTDFIHYWWYKIIKFRKKATSVTSYSRESRETFSFSELFGSECSKSRLLIDICKQRLQDKKEYTKTIQNLKMFKTKSPNFEIVKILQNWGTKEKKSTEPKKLNEINEGSAIILIIFCDFLMIQQIFLSAQVKPSVIMTKKTRIYELPQKLFNDSRVRILRN